MNSQQKFEEGDTVVTKMRTVKITNNITTITLDFPQGIEEFKQAVKNCLNDSKEYPCIDYSDNKDNILFTADFLKNSLIVFPK